MKTSRQSAFTIVEMLVVIAIIAVLVGVLLPAVNRARDQAKVTQSQANLRNLANAHATYSAEWNDRQFTLVKDDMSRYGDDAASAVINYISQNRKIDIDGSTRDSGEPPPIELGWGRTPGNPEPVLRAFRIAPAFPRNYALLEPIAFRAAYPEDSIPRMGYFRIPNARQFSKYLDGRFYNPVFYAPKDVVVNEMREQAADTPNEFTPLEQMRLNYEWREYDFCYASYSLSPAALFSPDVMAHDDDEDDMKNGWQDPWTLERVPGEPSGAAFRTPSYSQAQYANLKTHMLEHHWLQDPQSECNTLMGEQLRPYRGCQPYFFNQGRDSSPVTLFYDGHIELVNVLTAQRDDLRMRKQTRQDQWGLWSKDTPFGNDGYWLETAYDPSSDGSQAPNTSFHVLTTDGIKGRDVTSGG